MVPGVAETDRGEVAEWRLRVLHELLPDIQEFPGLLTPYTAFLRVLRERLHPIGLEDVRLVETASGLRFHVNLGDRLGADFYYGYYGELLEWELFRALLDPGATVVDIGANVGFYAVAAAMAVGASGIVHAFEADPAPYGLLVRNAEANGLQNVRCHPLCVGDRDGSTTFYLAEEPAFSGLADSGRSPVRGAVSLAMRRLDSVLGEADGVLAAMKIDVEGHEAAVLRGSRETIGRSPDIVIMAEVSSKNLDPERRNALRAELGELYTAGFRAWVLDAGPEGLRLLPGAPETAALGSANVFLVRSESARERRLRDCARQLREGTLEGLRRRVGTPWPPLQRRNAADPLDARNLHGALVGSLLRETSARLEAAERESEARLAELRRLEERLGGLSRQAQGLEADKASLIDALREAQASNQRLRARLGALQREVEARGHAARTLEGRGPEADSQQPRMAPRARQGEPRPGLWKRVRRAWRRLTGSGTPA